MALLGFSLTAKTEHTYVERVIGMGSVTKRGKNWRLKVELGYDANGKRRAPATKTVEAKNMTEAKQLLAEFTTEVKSGTYLKPTKISFERFTKIWDEYYAAEELESTTRQDYNYLLNADINVYFGSFYLEEISLFLLKKYFDEKKESGMSPSSLEKRHRVLRSVFKWAKKWRFIKEDNMVDIPTPRVPRVRRTVYNNSELEAFFATLLVNDKILLRHKVIICIFLSAALRKGELLGLDMEEDIFIDESYIIVRRSLQRTKESGYKLKQTKGGLERAVPIPAFVCELLAEYQKERLREKELCGESFKTLTDHNGIEVSLLFANADGKPFYPKTINQFWNRHIENYGFKKITIHEMRHTAATYLTDSIDMKTLQEFLGHQKFETTANTYSKSTDERLKKIGLKFNNLDPTKKSQI